MLLGSLLADTNKQIPPAALNASRNLKLPITGKALDSLAGLLRSSDTDPALRMESLNTLAAEKYAGLNDLLQLVLKSRDVRLRQRGRELLVPQSAVAMKAVDEVLAGSAKLNERQHAIGLLGRIETNQADQAISDLLSKLIAGKAAPGTELEILEVAEMRMDNGGIAEKLKQLETKRTSSDPLVAYSECLTGGDTKAGRTTFNTHIEAQCARCHRVGRKGSTVGPNLQSIGRTRDTKHLLRAIVAPSADIEPKYRTQTIILDSGKSISGVLVRRNDSTTVLADNQGKEITINNDEIDDAVEQNISIMPDMTKALSRREIRDLVAYLRSLRKK
jgi:putative heme-binding domain-containing protein